MSERYTNNIFKDVSRFDIFLLGVAVGMFVNTLILAWVT